MKSNWVPFTLAWNDAPIDISFVFEREAPAGKHGFLTVDGNRLVFEDGTEGRFWGTCFNSGANFPIHAYSEMVAKRLAKFGVNMMRTHQMDAEWATPNIFESNRANPKDNTRNFDPVSMDRLDYLIYCLKQEGIYIYLDLLTYRRFRPGDGVDAVGELGDAAKPYSCFDPKLIALQKEFARDLWTHINPYTGLAYKDDPAIALTELTNENDLFTRPVVLEPYRSRLEAQYRAWAEKEGLKVEEGRVDFTQPDELMARFYCKVMADYYREMIAYLRSIGVKIPINGTNWTRVLGILAANLATDFTDSHCYWNFPRWEHPEGTDIRPMVGEVDNNLAVLSCMRSLEKPFFVSEWDHAWPAPYRAESPLIYAAAAAFQGWSGLTIHTYRYGTHHPVDCMGATTINGVTYRMHFDTFNDPAKFGLFYHAALLFRRGDVQLAGKRVAIEIPEDMPSCRLKGPTEIPALALLSERHMVGMALPGEPGEADVRVPPGRPFVEQEAGEVLSDTGELWRSWSQRIGWIDTPRTKAAYGFLGEVGKVALKGLELEVKTDFATIALSSLTDEPIGESDALLLTAVGRCDNSGAKYDEEGIRMLDLGHAPVLIEPIEAVVKLETSRPNLKVWIIADNKEAVTPLPTVYEDGVLKFEIGPQPFYNRSTMYYVIRI
jgi:hypothetical protein